MRSPLSCCLIAVSMVSIPIVAVAQQADLPSAPKAVTLALSGQQQSTPTGGEPKSGKQPPPLVNPTTPTVSITRSDAERMALKNNPRITASQLLALAAGQVTRETRSAALPQLTGYLTGEEAEDGSRIGAGAGLPSSRLYSHSSQTSAIRVFWLRPTSSNNRPRTRLPSLRSRTCFWLLTKLSTDCSMLSRY